MSLALILSDVHHGEDAQRVQGSAAWPLFERFLEGVEAQQPELLIDLGDRINAADGPKAERFMAEVAEEFRHVGVHRVHVQGNDDTVPKPQQETLLGTPLGNQVFELGGWLLVFLETYDGSVEGAMSEDTLDWLEKTLATSTQPAILFSHQPLDGEPFPGNVFFGGEFRHEAHPKGHQALRRMLARSDRVKLSVAGHAHEGRAVTIDGVLYVTLDALVPFVGEARREVTYALLALTEGLARLETFGLESRMFEVAG